MKAIQVLGDAASPKIALNESMPKPEPTADELLVQVHAAGITGDEVQWPEVYDTPSRIPGHEISGVVANVGSEYRGSLKEGDSVYALASGAGQAEYAVCKAAEAVRKPTSISHAAAAAVPIPLLTALQAISEHGKVTRGMKVLVTGASGAVGLLFVQLATHVAGAHVIALASPRHHDALKQRGAAEVIDYHTLEWERGVTGVDVVFDAAGGEVLDKTWNTVTEKGTIVTIADPAPGWAFGGDPPKQAQDHPHVKYKYFIVSASLEGLEKGAKLFDEGTLQNIPIQSFPLDKGVEAWATAQTRNRGYKVVLEMRDAS